MVQKTKKKKKTASMKALPPAKLIAKMTGTKQDTVYKKRAGKRTSGPAAKLIDKAEREFVEWLDKWTEVNEAETAQGSDTTKLNSNKKAKTPKK